MATNKNLNILNKKLNEIVEKTKGSDIIWNKSFFADTYYNEQEKASKTAFNENTTEKLNEFIQLSDDILSLLKLLKKESEKDYLVGFSKTYNVIVNFFYDNNFSDSSDYFGITYGEVNARPYNILSIRHEIYKQVFKKIIDTLLIKNIDDYDLAYELPTSFNDTIEYINKGFYELESMMEGKIAKMKYFNIPRAIEKFNSLRNKYENKPKESLLLLDKYFTISQQIYNQIDQGEFENTDAFEDEIFMKTWNELSFFYDNMQSLFTQAEIDYLTPVGVTKVLDILNPLNAPQEEPVQVIKAKKETSKNIAFTYVGTSASFKPKITEFKNCLVDGGFIDKSTKLADFNKIFKNELPGNPIIWLGSRTDLKYLISSLKKMALIQSVGNDIWKITSNCFNVDGNTSYDFRKYKSLKNPTPSICNKLDRIIKVL
jgi:hypothetical protein